MRLSDFASCKSPEDFIQVAGGDLRLAETAAWALWEDSGPVGKRVQALSYIAQAIADQKFQSATA